MDLELPRRGKPGINSFNTGTAAMQAWVDDLPLLNTGKTLELVTDALDRINRLDIAPKQRHDALEFLSTPVMCINDALKKSFLGKSLPLQAGSLQQATQSIELCNRMACGYRIVVDDAGSNDSQRLLLVTAIHRAIRYLSEIMLTSFRIYLQYPDGLWDIIHALYALAEELRLATTSVLDNTLQAAASSSIVTIYKQILLLSLACPYRLRQNEIHYVYNGLLEWSTASHLHRLKNNYTPGLFAVDLRSDLPPSYRVLRDLRQTGNNWRILDTTEMAKQIQTAISRQAGTGSKPSGLGDAQTMQRLMLAWGVMPKRKFNRHHHDARVKMVMGLHSIHRSSALPAVEEKGEHNGITETIRDHQYLQDPTFEKTTTFNTRMHRDIDSSQGGAQKDQQGELLSGAYLATARGVNPVESWKMVNMSAGGYCLLWGSDAASGAQIGELVAIWSPEVSGQDNRQLGVIRWMKFTPEYGLELGIQLLSPGATAVWAYVRENDLQPNNKLQGFLLPEIKAIHQAASLLLPSLPIRTGCILNIGLEDRNLDITLTQQLENTGSFAQYNFKMSTGKDGAQA